MSLLGKDLGAIEAAYKEVQERYHTKCDLEGLASSFGWSLGIDDWETCDLVLKRKEIERQQGFSFRVRCLFSGDVPVWVQKDYIFPLEESW